MAPFSLLWGRHQKLTWGTFPPPPSPGKVGGAQVGELPPGAELPLRVLGAFAGRRELAGGAFGQRHDLRRSTHDSRRDGSGAEPPDFCLWGLSFLGPRGAQCDEGEGHESQVQVAFSLVCHSMC